MPLTATSTAACYPQGGVRRSASSSATGGMFVIHKPISSTGESAKVFLLRATDTKSAIAKAIVGFAQIHELATKRLLTALSILIEQDGDGYIAQTVDLPLYGSGDTAHAAIEMLKSEIESLHNDLMEDDNFSDEWLTRKKLLSAIVA